MKSLGLEGIKRRNEPPGFHVDQDDVRALIAEAERLRRIEDAARHWIDDNGEYNATKIMKLRKVLDENPRWPSTQEPSKR